MNSIKYIYQKHRAIVKYFFYSCISTVLDAITVRILFHTFELDLVLANTLGVVLGFIVSYLLSSKSVFNVDVGIASFAVFFGTFLLGLVIANVLIDNTYCLVIGHIPEILAFWLGKLASIVIPFFIMYYLRKFLYAKLRERIKDEDTI